MSLRHLLPYTKNIKQKDILDAIEDTNSRREAAEALGISERTLYRELEKIKTRAARHGDSPEHGLTHPSAPGFHLKGYSTLTRTEDGEPQWIKMMADPKAQIQLMIDALQESFEDFKGTSVPVSAPDTAMEDLLAVYPMGDPHIGLYAWAAETGEDFDCDIARRNLTQAVRNLVERTPPARTAVILNLGDFFHSDNMENRTSRSGAALDVDSRWARVLYIGARLMIECVYAALAKHEHVVVRNMIGNHDDHTSQALSLALSLYFEKEERVTVEEAPTKFWYYRFGKVLIGSTHGDTAKPDSLGGIMATDQSTAWGLTKHRYWYTGHIHNLNRKEYHGCVWESFRTLAAKDSWHTAMGYRAGRDMQSIVHHREYGEIERHTLNISMLGQELV